MLQRAWLFEQLCLHEPPRPPHFVVTHRWKSPRQSLSQSALLLRGGVTGPVGSGGGEVDPGGGGGGVAGVGGATGGSGGGQALSGGTQGTNEVPSHWRRSDALAEPNSQMTPFSSGVHVGGPASDDEARLRARRQMTRRTICAS